MHLDSKDFLLKVFFWRKIYVSNHLLTYVSKFIYNNMRKIQEQNVRKLTKVGRQSIAVTIPIEIVRELKWKTKQKVVVERVRGGIVIKDWKK